MESTTKRNRHDEMLQTEQLADKIELIQIVAEKTGATFDQVAHIYGIESINRLTEVLVDAGDTKDDHLESITETLHNEILNQRKWFYDNQHIFPIPILEKLIRCILICLVNRRKYRSRAMNHVLVPYIVYIDTCVGMFKQ